MTTHTDPAIKQQVQALIRMGAKELTNGDETVFLRLAQGNDPLRTEIETQLAEADGDTGPKPKADQLEESALEGGYLDNYLSLRAAGVCPSVEAAYFAAWYNAHPEVRQPRTVLGVANFLGRSRAVVYKWLAQDWFKSLALGEWREQLYIRHLADVDRMTISEAKSQTGAAGVTARRLFYDNIPGLLRAGPEVQVNVQQNNQVNVEEYGTSALDILRSRLDSIATTERKRIDLVGTDGGAS